MTAAANNAAWWNLVGRWRQHAAEFETNFRALLAQRSFVESRPALLRQWQQLVNDGMATRAKIVSITRTLDQVVGAAANAWDWVKGATGLQGLGLLPLVPIAVIAGSIAAVTKWLTDARQFSQRLEEARRLEGQGMPPAQAAALAAQKPGGAGGFKLFGLEVSPLAVAGIAAVILLPAVLPMLRGPR